MESLDSLPGSEFQEIHAQIRGYHSEKRSKKGEKAFNHNYPSMLSWPCEIKKRNLGPGYNPTNSSILLDYNMIDALRCIILFLQTEMATSGCIGILYSPIMHNEL